MRDLRLNENGDIIISGRDLHFVSDTSLTLQKVKQILSTNKGESLDENEGINFGVFLKKNPSEDEMLDTILDGLRQVDESFVITEYSFDTNKRHLTLTFKATNDSGEVIGLVMEKPLSGDDTSSWLIRALEDLVEVD